MEPAPSTLPQLDRMDESGYQPSGGISPYPDGGALDDHVGSAEATTRGWGSPHSDPGSPDGNFPGSSKGRSTVPVVDSGVSGGGVGIPFLPTVRVSKMWMQVALRRTPPCDHGRPKSSL